MLSLFKEMDLPISAQEALERAKKLLICSLNKGVLPTWETFQTELPSFQDHEQEELIHEHFQEMTQWPFLAKILELEATEFFFHSPSLSQFLNLKGQKVNLEVPLSLDDWQLWLEILSIKFKQNWNVQNPFCSFYGKLFGKDYRFSLIHASTSPENVSKLVLRRLAHTPHPLENFGQTHDLVQFVKTQKNILIAGSTGSGKTSLLTSLLDQIQPQEHLVILEDTFEILSKHPYQTRFLSMDSEKNSLKSYLSYSLRLSPDRMILGEIRSHEVVPFLMAMNTGHRGLMATIHASSAHDALYRVALLFSLYSGEASLSFDKVMELLCRNLEYVVFMENKKIQNVIKVLGSEKGVAFFETIIGVKEGTVSNLF